SPEEDARPGKLGIARRLHHVEVVGRQGGAQSGKSSGFLQSQDGENDRADEQNDSLHQIGVDNRREPAGNGVNAREHHQDQRGGERVPTYYSFQHYGGGVQVDGNLGENVGQDGDGRQVNRA